MLHLHIWPLVASLGAVTPPLSDRSRTALDLGSVVTQDKSPRRPAGHNSEALLTVESQVANPQHPPPLF